VNGRRAKERRRAERETHRDAVNGFLARRLLASEWSWEQDELEVRLVRPLESYWWEDGSKWTRDLEAKERYVFNAYRGADARGSVAVEIHDRAGMLEAKALTEEASDLITLSRAGAGRVGLACQSC
jgi:hypothetical protein